MRQGNNQRWTKVVMVIRPDAPSSLPSLIPPRRTGWAKAVLERFERTEPASPGWLEAGQLSVLVSATALLLLLLSRPAQPASEEPRREWLRRWACRLLFAVSVVNPFFSVLADDYTFVRDAASSYLAKRKRLHAVSKWSTEQELI